MKPGPDIEATSVYASCAYRNQKPVRIGSGEIKRSEYRSDQYGIYATRGERSEVKATYEGYRVGTTQVGLPLAGPRGTAAHDQHPQWIQADQFETLRIFAEEDHN